MKPMTYRVLIAVFAVGLCANLRAEEKREYPRISLAGNGGSPSPINRDELIMLVVDGAVLSYDKNPIAEAEAVEYINKLLEVKNVSYIGVYTREGTKYGDVVRALDLLRGTKAKNIALSMKELPLGREP